jgi:hypothetical protein
MTRLRHITKLSLLTVISAVIILSIMERGACGDIIPSGLSGGKWRIDGKVARYTQENLHTYINGEAELYFPYGFKVLESAFFVPSGSDKTDGVAVDLFLMGSPLDAFGIYSRYRSPDAEPLKVGADGIFSDGQIMFCKGLYFIKLSLSGDVQVDRNQFTAMAQEVGRLIPGKAEIPPEISLLQIPQLMPRSERFDASGLLGYRFLGGGISADAALGEKPVKIFIVLAPSPKAAASAFDDYVAYLKGKEATATVKEEGGAKTLTAVDPLYKSVVVQLKDGHLFGVIRLPEGESGIGLLEDIASRLKKNN